MASSTRLKNAVGWLGVFGKLSKRRPLKFSGGVSEEIARCRTDFEIYLMQCITIEAFELGLIRSTESIFAKCKNIFDVKSVSPKPSHNRPSHDHGVRMAR